MDAPIPTRISRRQFLISTVGIGAGLSLGISLTGCSENKPTPTQSTTGTTTEFSPNAFVRIHSNNDVTVVIKHLEMGQGTYTGLATVVAEELDAAWDQIKVESAPANAKLYKNLFWGAQGTGGSTAMANSFTQMRQAGAIARHMLVEAAAKRWSVPVSEISVANGIVSHANSGKHAHFGELAEAATQQAIPDEVFLKDPKEFRLIGHALPRKDRDDKVNGQAIYTQDVQLPGLLTAVVLHPPRFGATVKSFDATAAKQVIGVKHVIAIPTGVAVLADDFWSAKQGRDVLKVQWDESHAMQQSSTDIVKEYRVLANKTGAIARKDGNTKTALKKSVKVLHREYEFPFLAHAAMEPLNCVVQRTALGVEMWYGCQSQTSDQHAVAKLFGLDTDQVRIHTLYAGGSFGRRANPQSDYVLEAANIVKAGNLAVPVKLIWTREDDMRAGYFRPLYVHRVEAGIDKQGKITAWQHRIVGQSILASAGMLARMGKNGIDRTSVEGIANLPYHIPNIQVELHTTTLPVPIQWWRSVGSTHTAYAVETFLDEIAHAAKRDPLEIRRSLLQKHPRHLAVLNLAAEKAGWGSSLPSHRGRGIAVHESFNTYVAQVAEVTLHADKTFSVDRVVIAVDCGIAVNPDVIRAQMEGGMGFGLAAALNGKITIKQGHVEQSNFHDYPVLRMTQMPPKVEVHIVPSAEAPTGVGEPATPVIAPAVANALSSITGKRFHALPLPTTVT